MTRGRAPARIRGAAPPESLCVENEKLHFASFPDRTRAERAVADLALRIPADSDRAVRLHGTELDPLVAIDLGGTGAQDDRERDVMWRFTAPFAASVALGLVIDLAVLRVVGLPATVLLGPLGVVLGTLSVLMAPLRPMDWAFRRVDDAFDDGQTLLTFPVAGDGGRGARYTVERHGGQTLFDA